MPASGRNLASWTRRSLVLAVLALGCSQPAPQEPTAPRSEAPDLDRATLEQAVHRTVNDLRTRRRLPVFEWDEALMMLARTHSQDMARNNFFDHVNLKGEDPNLRGRRQGFECRKQQDNIVYEGLGENLFQTYRYGSYRRTTRGTETTFQFDWKGIDRIANETVEGWLNSPPHRENLLNPNYEAQGIGVAFSNDDKIYITQNLC